MSDEDAGVGRSDERRDGPERRQDEPPPGSSVPPREPPPGQQPGQWPQPGGQWPQTPSGPYGPYPPPGQYGGYPLMAPGPSGWAPPPPITVERGRPVPLRQMGVGEILDAAIKLYRTYWKVFLGIAAFVLVPFILAQDLAIFAAGGTVGSDLSQAFEPNTPPPPPGEVFGPLIPIITVGAIFGLLNLLLIQPFLTAAEARASAEAYLGYEPRVGGVYRFALSQFGSILWVLILNVLVIAVPLVVVVAVGVALSIGADSAAPVVLLVIAGIVFAIFAAIRLVFAPTTVVVEGARGTGALRRSWQLTRGSFWRVLGILLLAGILAAVVGAIFNAAFGFPAAAIGPNGWPLQTIGTILAQVVVRPFTALIAVLLYFDLRIRKEALDIAIMARDLGRPAPSAP